MENNLELLPRDKYDIERVNKLKNLDRESLLPLLPDLMVWIQDMNWPIAGDVAEILLAFPNEIVPLIHEVLATDDYVWKYWCIKILIKRMPQNLQQQFSSELGRLVENPTEVERMEELNEAALEVLEQSQL